MLQITIIGDHLKVPVLFCQSATIPGGQKRLKRTKPIRVACQKKWSARLNRVEVEIVFMCLFLFVALLIIVSLTDLHDW